MRTGLLCCTAIGALALSGVSPLYAQDGEVTDEQAQESDAQGAYAPIIVTAQKREQNLLEVPVSVNVLSGDMLRENQITTLEDIAQISPSVTYSQSANALNSSVRIRGIGTSVFSGSVEPSVSFVVDGVVMARQGQAFTDLIDIDRVEVLRGPQSTLFGKNASAGVISVTTKRPNTEYFDGEAELQIAEDEEYHLSATLSGPLTDTIAARLTGYYTDIGGHIDNVFDGSRLNGRQSEGLRGKVLWEPTDRLEFELIGDWRQSDDNCCTWEHRRIDDPFLAAAILPVVASETNDEVNIDAPVRNTTDAWGVSLNGKYDLGWAELSSITAYREWDFQNQNDIDGTPSQDVFPFVLSGIFGLDVNDNDQSLKQFSQEFRLTSTGEGPLKYVLGAYFFDLDYGGTFSRRLCFINASSGSCPAFPGARSSILSSEVKSNNMAVFGQLDYDLTDRLTLTGGLRYQRDHSRFEYAQPFNAVVVPGDVPAPVPAPLFTADGPNNPNRFGSGSVTDYALTGKAAIRYEIADNTNIYASYTRGYKGPAVDTAASLFDVYVNQVPPETSNAYELGLRTIGADGRIAFNLTGFLVKYKDFQGQIFDPIAGEVRTDSAGEVSTRGIEAELMFRPVDQLFLNAGLAYTDAKVDDYGQLGGCYIGDPDPTCAATATVITPNGFKSYDGNDLPNSPDWAINLNARYNLVLENAPFDMFFTGAYQWQDDLQFDLAGAPYTLQEAFGIANASLGITSKDKRITATAYVKNIFDKNFAGLIFGNPSAAVVAAGATGVNTAHFITKNASRYFGGSVRVKF